MRSQAEDERQIKIVELSRKVTENGQRLASKLPLLGHVCLLYSQMDTHKYFAMNDIDTRVLPPLLTEQCKLYIQSQSGGLPMGFVSWAKLSVEKEQQYIETKKLSPADWNSGDRVWLTDVLFPYGGHQRVFTELEHEVFNHTEVNTFVNEENGNLRRTTLKDLLAAKQDLEKIELESFKNSGDFEH